MTNPLSETHPVIKKIALLFACCVAVSCVQNSQAAQTAKRTTAQTQPANLKLPPKGTLDININGVAEFQGRQTALIEDNQTGIIAFYRPNDLIYGWRLDEITSEGIVLEKDSKKENYSLYIPSPAKHLRTNKGQELSFYDQAYVPAQLRSSAPTAVVKDLIEGETGDSKSSRKSSPLSVTLGRGRFVKPITSYSRVSSVFGTRRHPVTGRIKTHTGMDLSASTGTGTYAADSGQVIFSGWRGGYGRCIIIDHHNGYQTLYGHLSRTLVSTGANVARGSTIGKVGSTGVSTGPHLHFEIRQNGRPINPARHVSF